MSDITLGFADEWSMTLPHSASTTSLTTMVRIYVGRPCSMHRLCLVFMSTGAIQVYVRLFDDTLDHVAFAVACFVRAVTPDYVADDLLHAVGIIHHIIGSHPTSTPAAPDQAVTTGGNHHDGPSDPASA